MKSNYLLSFLLIIGLVLVGCNTTSDQTENLDVEVTNEEENETQENNHNETNEENEVQDQESSITLNTGSSETVMRNIEGMDNEKEVINYQIQPYNIAYQLDETFGEPEVKDNAIIYAGENDEYKIIIEIVEQTSLDIVVSDLQEKYETDQYEYTGELESITLEDDEMKGYRQSYGYPMTGFYAFEIDEHVLVITYQYPEEAGDGMGPLLDALRTSIQIQ